MHNLDKGFVILEIYVNMLLGKNTEYAFVNNYKLLHIRNQHRPNIEFVTLLFTYKLGLW